MSKRSRPGARKVVDLKDNLDAYRSSVAGAASAPAKSRNLAMASAASGAAALAMAPAAEATIQWSGPQNIQLGVTAPSFKQINFDGVTLPDFSLRQGPTGFGFKYEAHIESSDVGQRSLRS